MDAKDYWVECIGVASDDCGAALTKNQVESIAAAAQGAHECYGMAFGSPPGTDRIAAIERECGAKVRAAQEEAERIRDDFVRNVCMRRHCHPSDVMLEGDGHVSIRR